MGAKNSGDGFSKHRPPFYAFHWLPLKQQEPVLWFHTSKMHNLPQNKRTMNNSLQLRNTKALNKGLINVWNQHLYSFAESLLKFVNPL